METDIVDKLKANGNEEFKRGNFDEALNCYKQAIETEESLSKDFSKLAILHSNSAQVYLKQKKFDQAISAASTSLEHNPGFNKSLVRRGIANFELNKNEEAASDLRSFLRIEPNNQQAVSYLRKVFSFAKLSDGLRKAFIGHYLRHALIKWKPPFIQFCCDQLFGKLLFRLTVISLESLKVMKEFWKDGRVGAMTQGLCSLMLSTWFVVKRMKVNMVEKFLSVMFSKSVMIFILQVARPALILQLEEPFPALELAPLYEFDQVYSKSNFLFEDVSPNETPIKKFNDVAKILTGIAYFDEIPSVRLPKLDHLIIWPTRTIRTKFVNDWKKFKWPIKLIDFRSAVPNLSSFENFKGVLSHDLTDLRMGSDYSNSYDWQINFFPNLTERLTILKRCFPNLKNLIVNFSVTMTSNNEKLLSKSNFLKPYLKFLTTVIDAKKIDWCDKPKVYAEVCSEGETGSDALKNMKFIEKTVNECRNEMKELKLIRFNGPSMNKLRMIDDHCGYARIEMEANGVWFDISFRTM